MTRTRGVPRTRTTSRAPAARLRLEPLEDRTVPGVAYDPVTGRGELGGHAFFALTDLPPPPAAPRDGSFAPRDPPFDLADTFRLHTRPAAHQVIYLDFTGHTTTETAWNTVNHPSIVTPAFDTDGNPAAFSPAELERIQRIWQRVAEDFSPFDVDVTTEPPGPDRLRNTGPGDTDWGIRAVVGGDGSWFGPVAGVSFTGSFTWDTDTGCFVFPDRLGGDEKYTADTISHEVGHTLGLEHDGQTSPPDDYYEGHGTGPTGWAPIMGLGYYRELTQWSRGEYPNASNTQDDLAIITTRNGFGYRPDDHGDSSATATPATLTGPTQVSGAGVVEQSADADVFSFTAGAGPVSITVRPADRGPNLDIRAELYNASGTLLAADNPAGRLEATVLADVPAGHYFLRIDGTGEGNPPSDGYTDYGSLGQYSFVGTIPDPNPLRVVGVAALESAAGRVTGFRVSFNVPPDPASLQAGTVRVTGPAGGGVPILGVRAANLDRTAYDFRIDPRLLTGPGGVRVYVGPAASSTESRFLDQDGDGAAGEQADYFAAAAYRFASDAAGPIADGGTTDFPLVVDRSLSVRDVNVRVNLTHPYVGDLEVQLVAPSGKVIRLFDHRGADGNDLRETGFDDQAARSFDGAAAPFAGVFRPDGGTLADLVGDDAQGTWLLRVTDTYAAAAGQLNSWSLTVTTDSAQSGPVLQSVTPVNENRSLAATLVSGLELAFDRPMDPATVGRGDVWVFGPAGRPIPVLSVDPAAETDGTRFLIATAPWLRAGEYTVRVGPRVADAYGNGLDANGNGAFLEPADAVVTRHSVENAVFRWRHRPLVVPSSGGVTAALSIGASLRIGRLAVELNLQHPTVGNLRVTLIAPDGRHFLLADHRGGSGDNFVRTILSDDAAVSITDPAAAAPLRGDYRPEQPLSPLIGRRVTGTWKLRVEDTGFGELGQLLSWALYVVPL